jgi:hypothetical protein
MGRRTSGVKPDSEGRWKVDKRFAGTRLYRRGFESFEEAEKWMIRKLEELRAVEIHGLRPDRVFSEVAAHYLLKHQEKPSIVSETYHLKSVMPAIGHLPISQVHDGALAPHVAGSAGLGAGAQDDQPRTGDRAQDPEPVLDDLA